MTDIYLVIGESQSGKSATISALTGASRLKTSWPIEINTNPIVLDFYISIRSFQEGNNACSPTAFVNAVNTENAKQVIAASRYSAFNGQPDAQTYIDHFEQVAGWNIVGVCEIGVGHFSLNFQGNPHRINAQPKPITTANQRAALLRQGWNFS